MSGRLRRIGGGASAVVAARAPAGEATFLNAARRERELAELAAGGAVDVLVVGGGASGVGVALDAATRGLSVALVERGDLAAGTSGASSKLIHGGLRYLAQGDLAVAAECARERALLMSVIAPHLLEPLPQVLPLLKGSSKAGAAALALGLRIGDLLRIWARTSGRLLPAARRIAPLQAQALIPALAIGRLRGALLSYDARLLDDARLVVAIARTAAAYGARILTYCSAERLTGSGALVRERISGDLLQLRAAHVVNATGVWASALAATAPLCPSKGSHLLVDAGALGHPRAMLTVPAAEHFGRVVFAVPRPEGPLLLGTTDQPYSGSLDHVPVERAEEDYLIETISQALARPLERSALRGRYAGLRPLLDSGAAESADISRRHRLLEDPATGALSVLGGKLTTYRRMAEEALDVICGRPGVAAVPSRTARIPLVGAMQPGSGAHPAVVGQRAPGSALEDQGAAAARRLLERYGSEAEEIAALAQGRAQLLRPLAPGIPIMAVELIASLQREGALCAEDVLARRTRAGLIDGWREPVEAALAQLAPGLPARIGEPGRPASAAVAAGAEEDAGAGESG